MEIIGHYWFPGRFDYVFYVFGGISATYSKWSSRLGCNPDRYPRVRINTNDCAGHEFM